MFESREFNEDEKVLSEYIRSKAEYLAEIIMSMPNSRERSLALTKLEEAIMWANKAINISDKKE